MFISFGDAEFAGLVYQYWGNVIFLGYELRAKDWSWQCGANRVVVKMREEDEIF